jgi:predicted PurR-regulated permease PerM
VKVAKDLAQRFACVLLASMRVADELVEPNRPGCPQPSVGRAVRRPGRLVTYARRVGVTRVELRISDRTIVRALIVAAATVGVLYLLWLVRSTVILLFLSLFLAVALGPAVDWFARRGAPRALAVLLVYLCIALSIFGVGLLLVPPVVSGVNQLSSNAPGYVDHLRRSRTFRRYDDKYHITQRLNDQAKTLPARLGQAVGTLQAITVGVFGAVVQLIAVLTMSFFMLKEGSRVLAFVKRARGPTDNDRLERILGDIYRSTAGYVAGNLIISLCAGTTTYVTLAALGVPYAAPLAVLMAFLDLVPLVGATLGGVAIGLVTLFVEFPTATIIWVVVLVVYQQIENYILQPVVYRRTVDVHPLIVVVAILMGSRLLGILGALLAIPVAAAAQIMARELWAIRDERRSARLLDGGNPA